MADLLRLSAMPLRFEFMTISSYEGDRTGAVRIIQEIAAVRPIAGITLSAYDPAVEGSMAAAAAAVPLISECLLAVAPDHVQ